MANDSNPFGANPFGDVTRLMEQFKVPGLDMAPILASRKKDMDALIAANKGAFEAMQALAQKQTEILNEAMQDSAKAMTAGTSNDPTKQTQLVQQAFQKALTDMTTIAEMTRKSQVDAMNIIAKRAAESLEEIKKMMQPKG